MTNREIFKIYAPANKKWVDWVRPVPFMEINDNTPPYTPLNYILPCVKFIDTKNTAVIVDLPDIRSVEIGILLAKNGFRPIPVYNGVKEQTGSKAVTDNSAIIPALVWGAGVLSELELPDNAPPAFLTDSDRLQQHKISISLFDNSWDLYHQDLPSEKYFLNNGIERILVISNKISRDLKAIFYDYPEKKVEIWWTNGFDEPKRIKRFNRDKKYRVRDNN